MSSCILYNNYYDNSRYFPLATFVELQILWPYKRSSSLSSSRSSTNSYDAHLFISTWLALDEIIHVETARPFSEEFETSEKLNMDLFADPQQHIHRRWPQPPPLPPYHVVGTSRFREHFDIFDLGVPSEPTSRSNDDPDPRSHGEMVRKEERIRSCVPAIATVSKLFSCLFTSKKIAKVLVAQEPVSQVSPIDREYPQPPPSVWFTQRPTMRLHDSRMPSSRDSVLGLHPTGEANDHCPPQRSLGQENVRKQAKPRSGNPTYEIGEAIPLTQVTRRLRQPPVRGRRARQTAPSDRNKMWTQNGCQNVVASGYVAPRLSRRSMNFSYLAERADADADEKVDNHFVMGTFSTESDFQPANLDSVHPTVGEPCSTDPTIFRKDISWCDGTVFEPDSIPTDIPEAKRAAHRFDWDDFISDEETGEISLRIPEAKRVARRFSFSSDEGDNADELCKAYSNASVKEPMAEIIPNPGRFSFESLSYAADDFVGRLTEDNLKRLPSDLPVATRAERQTALSVSSSSSDESENEMARLPGALPMATPISQRAPLTNSSGSSDEAEAEMETTYMYGDEILENPPAYWDDQLEGWIETDIGNEYRDTPPSNWRHQAQSCPAVLQMVDRGNHISDYDESSHPSSYSSRVARINAYRDSVNIPDKLIPAFLQVDDWLEDTEYMSPICDLLFSLESGACLARSAHLWEDEWATPIDQSLFTDFDGTFA